jgi:polyhydroxyalkanoate synthesis regulator phasin
MDRQVGFIARVVFFNENAPLNAFIEQQSKIENADISSIVHRLKKGGIILVVEDFLYYFEITEEIKSRINTLMKKALKKYLHAEIEKAPDKNSFGIDEQIKQQELTIERAKANFDDLVKRSSKEQAEYSLALAEATLETLKNYRDNINILKFGLQ